VGEELGRGAFGQVYLGLDTRTGEHVAIKQLSLERLSSESLQGIMNEVELLRALNHRNIVKYLGSFRSKSHLVRRLGEGINRTLMRICMCSPGGGGGIQQLTRTMPQCTCLIPHVSCSRGDWRCVSAFADNFALIHTLRRYALQYIILEFMENGALSNVIKQNKFGPFPETLVAVYIQQVLQGLAYLHDQVSGRGCGGGRVSEGGLGRRCR
jgi:serine/threonine protein kinase